MLWKIIWIVFQSNISCMVKLENPAGKCYAFEHLVVQHRNYWLLSNHAFAEMTYIYSKPALPRLLFITQPSGYTRLEWTHHCIHTWEQMYSYCLTHGVYCWAFKCTLFIVLWNEMCAFPVLWLHNYGMYGSMGFSWWFKLNHILHFDLNFYLLNINPPIYSFIFYSLIIG